MSYSKLRLRRKQQGLCMNCGKKQNLGILLCPSCAIEHNRKSREFRAYRKNNGLCYTCGTGIIIPATYCPKCRNKASETINRLKKRKHSEGLCNCGNKAIIGRVCEIDWFKAMSVRNTGTVKNWEALKEKLEKQRYKCVYTKEVLVPGQNVSLDHIIPKCKGGTNDLSNLQWTTIFINTKMKRYMTHDEFISLLKTIIDNTQDFASI